MTKKPKLYLLASIWISLSLIASIMSVYNFFALKMEQMSAGLSTLSGLIAFVLLVLCIMLIIKTVQMNINAIRIDRVYLIILIILGTIRGYLFFSTNHVRIFAYFLPLFSFIPSILSLIYLFRSEVILISKKITEEKVEAKKRQKQGLKL